VAENAFTLKVVTPNEVFFEGPATSVVAPATLGYLGILKNHAPLLTTLEKGRLAYKDERGQVKAFRIDGGFLEVLKNRVLVLTDHAEAAEAPASIA
jgi:F-type H+-transporting ATPase subunit epsilon